jgi:hypothetical protein
MTLAGVSDTEVNAKNVTLYRSSYGWRNILGAVRLISWVRETLESGAHANAIFCPMKRVLQSPLNRP